VELSNPLVLVVEVTPDRRGLLCTTLEGAGIATRSAASAREALAELAAGLRPSLLVLDVRLPDMDGIEVLARLHGDPEIAAIPVVLVAGDAEDREVRGDARVLRVPSEIEAILGAVRASVARALVPTPSSPARGQTGP
jgi:CheY-like chemotaxis protein